MSEGYVLPVAKKRPKLGSVSEASKKLRLQIHETSNSCDCSRLKCFEVIGVQDQLAIIRHFNELKSHNEQSQHLAGLIAYEPVKRHRPRQTNDEDVDYHSFSYKYKVRVSRDNGTKEIPICYKAMLSLHGISAKRLQNIQQKLINDGHVSQDGRGLHSNRPNKLANETSDAVYSHIQSFKGRQSHYSLHKSKKTYLPEELNVRKMYQMFKELHPTKVISYESYRSIFVNKFNISFGYPHSDTCSTCDEYKVKKADPAQASQLAALNINNQVHLKKAEAFYSRKRSERKRAQKHNHIEAIAMDYQKNLSLPNITTNDVYYKRQLSFYLFNIHILASGEAIFYTYTQAAGKKGSDEEASILFHYILNELSPEAQELIIFCDSCCGQNKNYTLFRMLHCLVHKIGRLQCVKMIFPIRGHSYMECDRNMGLINTKALVELPSGWDDQIRNARVTKPF